MYKLDRTTFKAQTFEESNDDVAFWKSMTTDDVFDYAWLLTCQSFNIDPNYKLQMDRSIFSMRKMSVENE